MKREIKFRGKRNSNGEWIYGLPSYNSGGIPGRITGWSEPGDDSVGSYFDIEVVPETITEYIGLKDKNGKDIYQGDTIKNGFGIGVIIWDGVSCAFKIKWLRTELDDARSWIPFKGMKHNEVIGNIYENPKPYEAKCK